MVLTQWFYQGISKTTLPHEQKAKYWPRAVRIPEPWGQGSSQEDQWGDWGLASIVTTPEGP